MGDWFIQFAKVAGNVRYGFSNGGAKKTNRPWILMRLTMNDLLACHLWSLNKHQNELLPLRQNQKILQQHPRDFMDSANLLKLLLGHLREHVAIWPKVMFRFAQAVKSYTAFGKASGA